MNKVLFLAPLAVLALGATPALAEPDKAPPAKAQPPEEASVPFVSLGNVDDWRADGDQAIFFRDIHGQWYRATLMTRVIGLPFAEHIGIDARGTDRLDRFASVILEGQRYPIQSFVKADGPPAKPAKPGAVVKEAPAPKKIGPNN